MFLAVSGEHHLHLETCVRYALLTFGGILGVGRSGLITHLALCAQNNSKKRTDPTPGVNV